MNAEIVFCSGCSAPLASSLWERNPAFCPSCGEGVWVKVFPALQGMRAPNLPEKLEDQTEASCYYHEQNRASALCEECGRFLCELCAIQIPSGIVCPGCLESGISEKRVSTLENTRVMHDSIALAMATLPGLFVWPAVITAPLSLFWVIRHWRAPRSIIPRSRIRFYLAIVFALLELGFVGLIIFGIVLALRLRS